MRKKENQKDTSASMRFTWRGIIVIMIAVAFAAIFLLVGVGVAKNTSKTETNTENSKMQEISDIEHSSKQKTDLESGRWIYQGSHTGTSLKQEDAQYLEASVKKWIQGKLTDEELTEWITQRIRNLELPLQTVGVMSRQRCMFENENATPDYETQLKASDAIYTFIGLYTEDEVDEEGNLICYYWEAGAR